MLHDVTGGYQAYIQRNKVRSLLRPRAVSRLRSRFARDKIIKSLRSEKSIVGSLSVSVFAFGGRGVWCRLIQIPGLAPCLHGSHFFSLTSSPF